jgi:hypothetical protein
VIKVLFYYYYFYFNKIPQYLVLTPLRLIHQTTRKGLRIFNIPWHTPVMWQNDKANRPFLKKKFVTRFDPGLSSKYTKLYGEITYKPII